MSTPEQAAESEGAYRRRNNDGRVYPRWAGDDPLLKAAFDAGYDGAANDPLSPAAQNEIAKGWRQPHDDAWSNIAATPGFQWPTNQQEQQ